MTMNDPNREERLREHALAGVRRALGLPMEPATLRRLMAESIRPAAIAAAEANERITLETLRILVDRGVI